MKPGELLNALTQANIALEDANVRLKQANGKLAKENARLRRELKKPPLGALLEKSEANAAAARGMLECLYSAREALTAHIEEAEAHERRLAK